MGKLLFLAILLGSTVILVPFLMYCGGDRLTFRNKKWVLYNIETSKAFKVFGYAVVVLASTIISYYVTRAGLLR